MLKAAACPAAMARMAVLGPVTQSPPEKTPEAQPGNFKRIGRAEIEERDPFERACDFLHVEVPMTEEEALREAGRCLRCDFYGCGTMEGGRF